MISQLVKNLESKEVRENAARMTRVLQNAFNELEQLGMYPMPETVEQVLVTAAHGKGVDSVKAQAAVLMFGWQRMQQKPSAAYFMIAADNLEMLSASENEYLEQAQDQLLPQTQEEWTNNGSGNIDFALELYKCADAAQTEWKYMAARTIKLGLQMKGRKDVATAWWRKHLRAMGVKETQPEDTEEIKGSDVARRHVNDPFGRVTAPGGRYPRTPEAPPIRKDPVFPEIVWTRETLGCPPVGQHVEVKTQTQPVVRKVSPYGRARSLLGAAGEPARPLPAQKEQTVREWLEEALGGPLEHIEVEFEFEKKLRRQAAERKSAGLGKRRSKIKKDAQAGASKLRKGERPKKLKGDLGSKTQVGEGIKEALEQTGGLEESGLAPVPQEIAP